MDLEILNIGSQRLQSTSWIITNKFFGNKKNVCNISNLIVPQFIMPVNDKDYLYYYWFKSLFLSYPDNSYPTSATIIVFKNKAFDIAH